MKTIKRKIAVLFAIMIVGVSTSYSQQENTVDDNKTMVALTMNSHFGVNMIGRNGDLKKDLHIKIPNTQVNYGLTISLSCQRFALNGDFDLGFSAENYKKQSTCFVSQESKFYFSYMLFYDKTSSYQFSIKAFAGIGFETNLLFNGRKIKQDNITLEQAQDATFGLMQSNVFLPIGIKIGTNVVSFHVGFDIPLTYKNITAFGSSDSKIDGIHNLKGLPLNFGWSLGF
ncbi:MAG: hypothetical protein IJ213_09420 [Bacteroidales bacterium]|nr:hypothetical protein [Bacteroidales bacterium]MBQ9313245.1 hypothetical protein [Bacteroidales bacterium]